MDPHWKRYWAEMRHYSRVLPAAPLIALLPFLINFQHWREGEGVWVGLYSSLIYGIVIGLVILCGFGLTYAALTWITIKTGKFFQPPIPIQVLLGILGALAGIWLVAFFKNLLSDRPSQNPSLLPMMVFSGIIAVAFSLYFAYQQAQAEALALRAKSAEASLHVLEQQMRPHFLFNALNSLAELIESDRENAAETAHKLSELYRRILTNSGMKTAPLASELEIIKAYLELEQLRFGERLQFEIRSPENRGELYLPSLMLQTLVENAVKHGIAPCVSGGQVLIEIIPKGEDGFRASITNTGAELMTPITPGLGLANTQARLTLLYGKGHGFALRTDETGRTVAEFLFTGNSRQSSLMI